MSNIVKFPPISRTTKTTGSAAKEEKIHVVDISKMCLAVAYYAGTGQPDKAAEVLKYLDVYKLYDNFCHVTAEVEQLTDEIDVGMAALGTFPEESK